MLALFHIWSTTMWVRLKAQNDQKQIHFFGNSSDYSCFEKISLFHARHCQEIEDFVQRCVPLSHKLVLTRIERVGGPGAQLSKRTSTLECLVLETDASFYSGQKQFVLFCEGSSTQRWLLIMGLCTPMQMFDKKISCFQLQQSFTTLTMSTLYF